MKRISAIFILGIVASCTYAEEQKLIWSDEFNYEGLPNPEKWSYEEGFIRNKEAQYYTKERKENVRVENGVLIIECKKETFKNPHYKQTSKNRQQKKLAHYTSGSINTLGKGEFKYGRIEVRAKMPQGKGVWPAIWMMGINRSDVKWPRCGEIDIMEYVGKQPFKVHCNIHFADPNIKNKSVHKSGGSGKMTIKDPFDEFHIYAVEWNKKQIIFFVDNKKYATFDIDSAGKGADNPFRKKHYILLNFAIGGSWGGKIDDNMLPQKYEIDYVRIFKHNI